MPVDQTTLAVYDRITFLSKQKYGWARFHRRMQPPNPLEAVEPENSLETAATNAFRDPPYWIYSHSRGVIQAVTCIWSLYAAASWDIWVLSLFVVTCIAINLQNQKKKKKSAKMRFKKDASMYHTPRPCKACIWLEPENRTNNCVLTTLRKWWDKLPFSSGPKSGTTAWMGKTLVRLL